MKVSTSTTRTTTFIEIADRRLLRIAAVTIDIVTPAAPLLPYRRTSECPAAKGVAPFLLEVPSTTGEHLLLSSRLRPLSSTSHQRLRAVRRRCHGWTRRSNRTRTTSSPLSNVSPTKEDGQPPRNPRDTEPPCRSRSSAAQSCHGQLQVGLRRHRYRASFDRGPIRPRDGALSSDADVSGPHQRPAPSSPHRHPSRIVRRRTCRRHGFFLSLSSLSPRASMVCIWSMSFLCSLVGSVRALSPFRLPRLRPPCYVSSPAVESSSVSSSHHPTRLDPM